MSPLDAPLPRFVRDVLGCGCPDSLLAAIRPSHDPGDVAGLPLEVTLDVGGRLLVYVTSLEDPRTLGASLASVFDAGRRARDRAGYHRFRFVVAASDADAVRADLMRAFHGLSGHDDRQHLHVVARDDVPAT